MRCSPPVSGNLFENYLESDAQGLYIVEFGYSYLSWSRSSGVKDIGFSFGRDLKHDLIISFGVRGHGTGDLRVF